MFLFFGRILHAWGQKTRFAGVWVKGAFAVGGERLRKLNKEDIGTFAGTFLRTMDPARAAAAIGAGDGLEILARQEVRAYLEQMRRTLDKAFTPEDTVRRMVELAFGRTNDCVRLALESDVDIDKLDLSLLSEIKRSDKGTVEVKLMDRMRVLERLLELGGGRDEASDLFRALCQACGDGAQDEQTEE